MYMRLQEFRIRNSYLQLFDYRKDYLPLLLQAPLHRSNYHGDPEDGIHSSPGTEGGIHSSHQVEILEGVAPKNIE